MTVEQLPQKSSHRREAPHRGRRERLRICLAYPSLYRTGMSNLGFQVIYRILDNFPGISCDLVFLPDQDGPQKRSRTGATLTSLQTGKPLRNFDIIAFSVSFEGDYPGILQMIDSGGISLLQRDRRHDQPLIIAGGIAVTLNPEPLTDFFDLFLVGEGEELLPEFCQKYLDLKDRYSREQILATLQRELAGVYVPSCYRPDEGNPGRLLPTHPDFPARITRRRILDLGRFPAGEYFQGAGSEFGDMYLLEVNRGCGRGCRFCAAGWLYRPVRFRSMEALTPALEEGVTTKGRVGLVGTAVSDHPELPSLCAGILARGGKLGIGSLRIDRINEDILKLLRAGGVETLALAPEAGTQRLREVIGKNISEDDLHEMACLLREQGFRSIRLYFMVGLPTEREEDIQGIIELAEKVKKWGRDPSGGASGFRKITLSISQFIPKPGTPFQWLPLADIGNVKKRLNLIRRAFRGDRAIRVLFNPPSQNYIQALLSLGDRRTGALLLAVHKFGGRWPQALKAAPFDPDRYLYRRKSFEESLPWEIIDHGIERSTLMREFTKALETEE